MCQKQKGKWIMCKSEYAHMYSMIYFSLKFANEWTKRNETKTLLDRLKIYIKFYAWQNHDIQFENYLIFSLKSIDLQLRQANSKNNSKLFWRHFIWMSKTIWIYLELSHTLNVRMECSVLSSKRFDWSIFLCPFHENTISNRKSCIFTPPVRKT